MAKQQVLLKGEDMEEKLRNYFLSLGFYVVRSIDFEYRNFSITDIDLFLYKKASPFTRVRINVDIKNKKTPQAIERVFWTKGLQQVLKFDKCIVATTDKRNEVVKFGELNEVLVLGGNFLTKLKEVDNKLRLTEEEIELELKKISSKSNNGGDWRSIYKSSKSKLIQAIDYSNVNDSINDLSYIFEKKITTPTQEIIATRGIYISISHILITLDLLLSQIAHLNQEERLRKLADGFMYGSLGKDGIEKTIDLALQISNQNKKNKYRLLQQFQSVPYQILAEFFSKNNINGKLFDYALAFEKEGFSRNINNPNNLPSEQKAIIGIFLDYHRISRKDFFA
jgi:hypothetical protein